MDSVFGASPMRLAIRFSRWKVPRVRNAPFTEYHWQVDGELQVEQISRVTINSPVGALLNSIPTIRDMVPLESVNEYEPRGRAFSRANSVSTLL